MKSLLLKIIVASTLTLVLGIASGFSTIESITTWYQYLNKPSFNPPNYLFGPVWSVLYLMMGVAFALVWHSQDTRKRQAMWVFGVQFVLNLAWSFLFFNLHQTGWALIEIIIMWLSVAWTIRLFYPIKPLAAYLLVPYVAWVSFASVLNGAIWYLN